MKFRHVLIAITLFIVLARSKSWGQTVSVQELQASRSKYLGRSTSVEGRLTSYGTNIIRLRNCDVVFRTATTIPTLPRLPRYLEITGRLTLEEGRYVFLVDEYKERSSDLEAFQERRRAIRDNTATAWYELAAWAQARGKFYNDAALLEKAESASLHGVEIERAQGAPDRARHLLALAEKSRGFELPESLRLSLIHESCLELGKSNDKQKLNAAELDRVAVTFNQLLPGCLTPLKGDHTKLLASYKTNPIGVYDRSAEADRLVIHRSLYADVVRRSIETQLAADGSNGFEIAELLDQRVPEFHALADKLRDRTLDKRAAEVQQRTRPEVLQLAADYRQQKKEAQARQVIESWLTLRQRKLDPDDIEATLVLSDDYRTLLQGSDTANRLLHSAVQRHPESTELRERLQRAGFRLRDGTWQSEKELAGRPEDRLERALREGRVEAGMTGAMVRRSLGEPRSTSRSATSGQIMEVWTYSQGGHLRQTASKSESGPNLSAD